MTSDVTAAAIAKMYVADDWCVAELEGDLDVVTGGELGRALISLVEEYKHVVVECSKLGLVDSAGLRALVQANNEARRGDGKFVLASIPALLSRLLEITRLTDVLTVVESVEDVEFLGGE